MLMTEAIDGQVVCLPRRLPSDQLVDAARNAAEINPVNHPPVERLARIAPDFQPTRERIAVLTTKYWGTGGVQLTVGFLDDPPADLRARILSHMNAWSKVANVQFVETVTNPRVRIARTPGDGHWSYLGTDIDLIPADEPTMNLDSFTMNTPESEYRRVVRHETGHTMGFPHEHMRRELVERINEAKAIEYFRRTQGWNEVEVRRQVLTPLEESSLLGTPHADPNSIMCYQIPGEITKDGKPIIGGLDIDELDYSFVATIYPKLGASPPRAEMSALAVPELIGKLAQLKDTGAITNEEFEAKKAELLSRI
jgi:hypothetical protein